MDQNNNNKNIGSRKRVLCKPMLNDKKCDYGNKCVYAHSLNDQKVDPMRHKAYAIISHTKNLSHIDLVNDDELYEHLNALTKICSLCAKGLCPGGYNCRYGSVSPDTQVCFNDLMYGNCKKPNCTAVHLTKKGLVPRAVQQGLIDKNEIDDVKKKMGKDQDENSPKDDDSNGTNESGDIDENKKRRRFHKPKKYYTKYEPRYFNQKMFKNKYKYDIDNESDEEEKDNTKYKRASNLDEITGNLLTEKFLLSHFGEKIEMSDSGSDEDVEEIIKYLNNDSGSENDTIFDVKTETEN